MALEIFIPNTGQGDTTFIKFPNGKNMLVDMNKTSVDVDIIEFLKENIPITYHPYFEKRLNYFVNTHPHDDHLKGIKSLAEEFYIDEIWESNQRLFIKDNFWWKNAISYIPANEREEYQNYDDFLDLIEKKKQTGVWRELKSARSVFKQIGATKIYVFGPSKYHLSETHSDAHSTEEVHSQCGVIKIEYSGNSILFAGDSNRHIWENRIVPYYSDDMEIDGKKQDNLLKSTVLHVSHHGSKYFFVEGGEHYNQYKRHMDKINPRFSIISVGTENRHNHPDMLAQSIYKEKTERSRVYQTNREKSIYFAFFSDGRVKCKKNLSFNELVSAQPNCESNNI